MIPLFYVLWPALMLTAMQQRSVTANAAAPALPAPTDASGDAPGDASGDAPAEPAGTAADPATNILRYPIERIGAPVSVRERSAEVVDLKAHRRV